MVAVSLRRPISYQVDRQMAHAPSPSAPRSGHVFRAPPRIREMIMRADCSGVSPSALATAFLMSSPRIPRATILPSGPTSTNAGIARMPNLPGVGPWMPPPRKPCDQGSCRFAWNFLGSSIFSSTLRLRIANRSSVAKGVVNGLELGISLIQGPHQVAQKSSRTNLPLNSLEFQWLAVEGRRLDRRRNGAGAGAHSCGTTTPPRQSAFQARPRRPAWSVPRSIGPAFSGRHGAGGG